MAWLDKHVVAFEELKRALITEPVLKIPIRVGVRGHHSFILDTDASDTAIAGVLSQWDDGDAAVHPCMFLSRKLQPAETRYTVTERECLAIVYAVQQCKHLLM